MQYTQYLMVPNVSAFSYTNKYDDIILCIQLTKDNILRVTFGSK